MSASLFAITPTPPTILALKPGEEGKFSFTVASQAAPDNVQDVMFRAMLVGKDGRREEAAWLTAEPRRIPRLSGGTTEVVTIIATPTDLSPAGENRIQLAVYDNDQPHDSYTYSSPVVCEVVAPPVPKPHDKVRLPGWLIPAIVAAVLLGAGALAIAWIGRAEPAPDPANPWTVCGTFEDLRTGAVKCEINHFPVDRYEYGFKYNSSEVHVADCLLWNVGVRIINRHPYVVHSDDPTNGGMQLGGALYYTETNATDDDTPAPCPANTWRHRYWRIVAGSVALDLFTNGCVNLSVFCRRR